MVFHIYFLLLKICAFCPNCQQTCSKRALFSLLQTNNTLWWNYNVVNHVLSQVLRYYCTFSVDVWKWFSKVVSLLVGTRNSRGRGSQTNLAKQTLRNLGIASCLPLLQSTCLEFFFDLSLFPPRVDMKGVTKYVHFCPATYTILQRKFHSFSYKNSIFFQ